MDVALWGHGLVSEHGRARLMVGLGDLRGCFNFSDSVILWPILFSLPCAASVTFDSQKS